MATVAPSTAGVVEVIEWGIQETNNCAADIVGGTFVRKDANGDWVQALADTAPHGAGPRLALASRKAGEALTAMKSGVVGGFTVSQAMNAALYLSDTGTLADAAGTVSITVARVEPGNANLPTASRDKVVRLDCPL